MRTPTLDERICALCPLGPKPLQHKACDRCVADMVALEARDALVESFGDRFRFDGVMYADSLRYDLLTNFLPGGDPGA